MPHHDTAGLRLTVQVLSVAHVLDFRGRALVAGIRPKFVVALAIDGEDRMLVDEASGIRLATRRVVLFALDSVARLFGDRDVVGRTYDIEVRSFGPSEAPRFFLSLA